MFRFSCRECRRALRTRLTGTPLSANAQAHLQTCAECAREERMLSNLAADLGSLPAPTTPPDLPQRVRAALELEATAQTTATQIAPQNVPPKPAPFSRASLAWGGGLSLGTAALVLFALSNRSQFAPSSTSTVSTSSDSTLQAEKTKPDAAQTFASPAKKNAARDAARNAATGNTATGVAAAGRPTAGTPAKTPIAGAPNISPPQLQAPNGEAQTTTTTKTTKPATIPAPNAATPGATNDFAAQSRAQSGAAGSGSVGSGSVGSGASNPTRNGFMPPPLPKPPASSRERAFSSVAPSQAAPSQAAPSQSAPSQLRRATSPASPAATQLRERSQTNNASRDGNALQPRPQNAVVATLRFLPEVARGGAPNAGSLKQSGGSFAASSNGTLKAGGGSRNATGSADANGAESANNQDSFSAGGDARGGGFAAGTSSGGRVPPTREADAARAEAPPGSNARSAAPNNGAAPAPAPAPPQNASDAQSAPALGADQSADSVPHLPVDPRPPGALFSPQKSARTQRKTTLRGNVSGGVAVVRATLQVAPTRDLKNARLELLLPDNVALLAPFAASAGARVIVWRGDLKSGQNVQVPLQLRASTGVVPDLRLQVVTQTGVEQILTLRSPSR